MATVPAPSHSLPGLASQVISGLVATYECLLAALCESAENWARPVAQLLPEAGPVRPYRPDCCLSWRFLQDGVVHHRSVPRPLFFKGPSEPVGTVGVAEG